MTVFSIFHFSNNHHTRKVILYTVSIAPMPTLLFLRPPLPFLPSQPATSSTALWSTKTVSGTAVLLESILCTWGFLFSYP